MSEAILTEHPGGEIYRPRLHYTAADTWINDPNGLVYADGRYHLFYQTNPHGSDHANMSWGHAVSTDLLHWHDRPIAILCDDAEQIYSGSAVIDEDNTAGFGPPGSAPLVAIYTSYYTENSPYPGIQAQSLAYSLDGGNTWIKHHDNPVLNRDSADFRDPKVFRYRGPSGAYWVMVAVEAADQKVVFYRSEDLRQWTYLSQFEAFGRAGTLWECPDLFPLPVDDDPRNLKWVLLVSVTVDPEDGRPGCIYFIGDFDGESFTTGNLNTHSDHQPTWQWLDHGRDYFATVSFNDAPHGRRILLGWMNNWTYARALPTAPWRGAMALPRDASLHTDGDKLYLTHRVAAHPEPAGTAHIVERREIPEGVHPLSAEGTNQPCLIEATLAPGKSTECGLIICQGEQEGTHVGYRAQRGELAVDRTRSGDVGFSPHFPGQDTAPVDLIDGRLRLRLLVDSSSVEVFAQDGRVTITNQIFPDPSSRGLAVYAAGGTAQLISLTVTPLRAALLVRHRRPRNRASSRTGHRG